jgi:hypothetical protein
MRLDVLGAIVALGACAVLVTGLCARRTRVLAALGLAAAACALAACAARALAPEVGLPARHAHALVAVAAGLAHAVALLLLPFPRERVVLRAPLAAAGAACGLLGAAWIEADGAHVALDVVLALAALATAAAWIAWLAWTRAASARGGPSVRFACPRCGTRVDWRRGAEPCTDCGLFLHIAWPAEAQPQPSASPRALRFACPQCGTRGRWSNGSSACARCGLSVALYWNTHGAGV